MVSFQTVFKAQGKNTVAMPFYVFRRGIYTCPLQIKISAL
jgi:hypothetical protein